MGVVIIGIVITMVMLTFPKLNQNQKLDKEALNVASILEEARSLSLSSQGGKQYGVRIQGSQVILLPDYATTMLNSLVGIRNINLTSGTSTIWFKRLSGNTDQNGSFEVYLISSSSSYKTIRVSKVGNIDL